MSVDVSRWLTAHLANGWRSFAFFLRDCSRKGVVFDAAHLAQLELAQQAFADVIELQKALRDTHGHQ